MPALRGHRAARLMTSAMESFDVVIVGAGAAGLMCAITAGQSRPARAAARSCRPAGAKILISGGGRCNFTNLEISARALSLRQPALLQIRAQPLHAARFHRAGRAPSHCLSREDPRPAVLRRIGARDPRDAAGGMRGRRRRPARSDTASPRSSRADRFRIETNHAGFDRAGVGARDRRPLDSKDGRDRLRLRGRAALRSCGHRAAPGPGAADESPARRSNFAEPLSGVSAGCSRFTWPDSFRESILFTHRGLSGPAILQISSYWREGDTLSLDLAPSLDVEASCDGPQTHAAQG